ncbi:MAG: maleylpyruvate isomerase family mycothiol-dependent enzyme [Actinomycetota bacterium]|nr:maleylpyruvate isomerase family mycothiol-dependent enzyme [Actinomycetota bacterium]
MREILSDLVAEEQQLDQFLQSLSTRQWKWPTATADWTIQDQVSHLAYVERFAAEVIAEGPARIKAEKIADLDEWYARGPAEGLGQRHQEVIEWWRHGRADVVDALSRMLATDRIPWIYGDMSAKTFATMRLMKTWAHGLDIKGAVLGRITPLPEEELEEDEEDPLADTPRLRHIAWLGHKMLPVSFEEAGETFPKQGIRVEVMGPKYSAWRFGSEETDQVIRGMAGDWCRVIVQRQDASETGMKAVGESAERGLEIARVF